MKVTATLNNLRTSPRKVRLVANLIKGMDAKQALIQLENTVKKSSDNILKLLASAIANAENNFGIDTDNLYVADIQVGEGSRLKRWLPRAHGRATLLLKRTSKIYLTLEEKVEGKNRKSKEQLEKERAQKEAARKKAEEALAKELAKEEVKEDEKEGKKEEKKAPVKKRTTKKASEVKKGQDEGFLKKVFNRKSA